MKKYLSMLIVMFLLIIAYAANETSHVTNTNDNSVTPNNVGLITLYDNEADASDSMAATEMVIHGPFPLAKSTGEPMYKGFGIVAHAVTGVTTDSVVMTYQLTAKRNVTDTSTVGWILIDTLSENGITASDAYVDLTSKAGRYLWFRFDNYTGDTTVINDWLYILPKYDLDYTINK